MRDNFFNKIQTLIPSIRHLPINDLIIELMNSSIYFINIQLIKFISSCLIFGTNCYQCNFIIFICNIALLSLLLFLCFCNTARFIVMQIKLLVVVVVVVVILCVQRRIPLHVGAYLSLARAAASFWCKPRLSPYSLNRELNFEKMPWNRSVPSIFQYSVS